MSASDADPVRTAEALRKLHHDGTTALVVTWLMVLGDREAYASRLRAALAGQPIAVVVLREALFENVNAVMADIVSLIETNRAVCGECWSEEEERVSVLILARAPLQVPQVSSPVVLPDWVPCAGGRQALAIIRDLTFAIDVPLSSNELAGGEISEALYDLDLTLTRRLAEIAVSHPARTSDFWVRIRRRPDERLDSFLNSAGIAHRQVQAPASFRPSVRHGLTLVSRMWDLSLAGNSSVVQVASELEQSLLLPNDVSTPPDSIMTVIRRPAARLSSNGHRFAYDLLVTAGAACQLITSAAHADNYPRYPTVLLTSLSQNLRRSLVAFEGLLGALPPSSPS